MYSNSARETQYHLREFDSEESALHGDQQYTITFPKGQLPPVKGFWSLSCTTTKNSSLRTR